MDKFANLQVSLLAAIVTLFYCSGYARSTTMTIFDDETKRIVQGIEKTKDYKLCLSNSKLNVRAQGACVMRLAYITKSTKPCDSFTRKALVSDCTGLVALATGKYSLCNKFKKRYHYNLCQQADDKSIKNIFKLKTGSEHKAK